MKDENLAFYSDDMLPKKRCPLNFNGPILSTIAVISGVFGQPVVHYPCSYCPILTISQTPQTACAIASPGTHPMGLDFESIHEAKTDVMKSQMTSDERSTFLDVMESEITGLTIMWSAKEALSKILMCGLTCPFDLLVISSLRRNEDYYEGEYLNFQQYKFQSWVTETSVCTVAFPKRTQIKTDMNLFREEFA